MRKSRVKTVVNSYVIDDGWNLPREVIEEIEFSIERSHREKKELAIRLKKEHKGRWLTRKAADFYAARAFIYRAAYEDEYIGKLRELGEELQKKYGITELEATNILRGRNVADYVNKYRRIKKLDITGGKTDQEICDEIAMRYLEAI